MRYQTISFLSDYGRVDEHVGVCRSVIRSIAPDVMLIDLAHEFDRGDLRAAGLALARSAEYLCPGVVLVAVGAEETERPPVAISVGDRASILVGPDNGVLAPAVAMVGGADEAVALTVTDHHLASPGRSFVGRDILAPVAARLCLGADLAELGVPVDPNALLPGVLGVAERDATALSAEVLWIDRRGNAQLNAGPEDLEGWGDAFQLRVGDDLRRARRVERPSEVGPAEVALIVDAYGLLALAADRGAVATELGLSPGARVRLVPVDTGDPAEVASIAVQLGRRHVER